MDHSLNACTNSTMSTSGRKRHRALAAAAIDERMSRLSTNRCRYLGCQSQSDSGPERSFCGQWHRDLHMSNLANMWRALSTPSQGPELLAISSVAAAQRADGNNPKCMLPECTKRASLDPNTGQLFDFCRMKHMLEMVERLTKVWSLQGKLCRLDDCYKHVHVEDNGECQEYCGRTHAKLAAARRGALVWPAAAPNLEAIENMSFAYDRVHRDESDEQRSQTSSEQGEKATTKSLIDSLTGYQEKISDSHLHRLLKGEGDGGGVEGCPSVVHGIDIYESHPWELVSKFDGKMPRYFLHEGHTPKKRTTKNGFGWKQTGRRHENSNNLIWTRYMSYKHGKTEEEEDEEWCRWRLREITLPDSSQTKCRKVIWRIVRVPAVSSSHVKTSNGIIQPGNVPIEEDIPHEGLGYSRADVTGLQVDSENDSEASEKSTGALTMAANFSPDDTQMDFALEAWNLNEDFNPRDNQISLENFAPAEDLHDFTRVGFDLAGKTQIDLETHFGGHYGPQKQSHMK